MIPPAGHISDHHIGHGRHLTILGLLDEDGHTTRDDLAVKLDALGTGNELAIRVVSCTRRKYKRGE